MRAYRYLLYQAMLEIRCIGQSPIEMRRAGAVANWLHNLSLYSAHDFEGFNEQWFWQEYETLNERNPDYRLSSFKEVFERVLAGKTGPHGWSSSKLNVQQDALAEPPSHCRWWQFWKRQS
jgi:hypothetical protein